MAKQRFKAKLKEGTPGGGGHLVEVPKKVVEGLGGVIAKAGVSVGDMLDVVAENGDTPRPVDVPEDLAKALRTKRLTAAWDSLSFTRRKEFASWVADAKKDETRTRRIETTLALVAEGKGRDS